MGIVCPCVCRALLLSSARHVSVAMLLDCTWLRNGDLAVSSAGGIVVITQPSPNGEKGCNNCRPLDIPAFELMEQYDGSQIGDYEDDCYPEQQVPSMACRRQQKAAADRVPASCMISHPDSPSSP